MIIKTYARTCALAVAVLAAAPAMTQPNPAAPAPQPNWGPPVQGVCVLDGGKAIRTSAAGLAAQQQMNAFSTQAQNDIAATRDALVRDDKALTAAKPTLQPADFTAKAQALRQRQAALQREVQARNAQLEATRNQANARIGQVMAATASEVVTQRRCAMVFDRERMFAVNPAMDMTDQVVQLMNQRLPTIQLTLAPRQGAPAPTAAAPPPPPPRR